MSTQEKEVNMVREEEEEEEEEDEELLEKNEEPKTYWQKFVDWFWRFEDGLATVCGLNTSKYEWAVRDYYYYKQQEEEKARIAAESQLHDPEDVRLDALESQAMTDTSVGQTRKHKEIRRSSLGLLSSFPDEHLLTLFSLLDPTDLGRAACASKAMYVLATHEEFWRAHVLEDIPDHFEFQESWRSTWLHHRRPGHDWAKCRGIKVRGFFSDLLYQPYHCSSAPILDEWVETENMERVHCPTPEDFRTRFEIPNRPCIVTGVVNQWPAFKKWNRKHLLKHFGDRDLVAGGHRLTLKEYYRYSDRQWCEMPIYLFDKAFAELAPGLAAEYSVPDIFPEDLFGVLGKGRPDHKWIIIGPERSGSSFHVDPNQTSAWNAVVKGRKKWVLFPPSITPPGVVSSADGASVATSVSIIEWFLNNHESLRELDPPPLEGICNAGELVFVPRGWWHLVINLEESVALTHNYVSTVNLPHVLRFLSSRSDELVSGLPAEQRAGLYDRFVAALREKVPAALAAAEAAEAKRQKAIEDSHRLASLFGGGQGGQQHHGGRGEGRADEALSVSGRRNGEGEGNGLAAHGGEGKGSQANGRLEPEPKALGSAGERCGGAAASGLNGAAVGPAAGTGGGGGFKFGFSVDAGAGPGQPAGATPGSGSEAQAQLESGTGGTDGFSFGFKV